MSSAEEQMVYVWEFEVAPGKESDFLRHYDSAGVWVSLFSTSPGFYGTELLRDSGNPMRFFTLDRWRSAAEREAFIAANRADYDRVDQVCSAFTVREVSLGAFTVVRSPGSN